MLQMLDTKLCNFGSLKADDYSALNSSALTPHCVYVFRVTVITNTGYFPIHHSPVVFKMKPPLCVSRNV